MNCRDRYEIIGLLKILHSIKQPCGSVPEKSTGNASKMFTKTKKQMFCDLQQAFEISNLTQISSA